MKISRKQIRRIIREELNRELPISYYSDEMLMQEGLLDWLGDLFGKLVGFFTGAADKGVSKSQEYVADAKGRIEQLIDKYEVDDMKSLDDADWKNEKHRRIVFEATAPWAGSEVVLPQIEELEAAAKIKDWTPADDSEDAAKKWEEENGTAAAGLWEVMGEDMGCTEFFTEIGAPYFGDAISIGKTAMESGNPGEAAKYIVTAAAGWVACWKDAIKLKTPGADDALSTSKTFGKAGQAVASAIEASGKEQQKESLELRKMINALTQQVIRS